MLNIAGQSLMGEHERQSISKKNRQGPALTNDSQVDYRVVSGRGDIVHPARVNALVRRHRRRQYQARRRSVDDEIAPRGQQSGI